MMVLLMLMTMMMLMMMVPMIFGHPFDSTTCQGDASRACDAMRVYGEKWVVMVFGLRYAARL